MTWPWKLMGELLYHSPLPWNPATSEQKYLHNLSLTAFAFAEQWLLPWREMGSRPWGYGSLLQLPGISQFVSRSSVSMNPGGICSELPWSLVLRKLCKATHANTTSSTFSGTKFMGSITTLNQLAKIPKTFSDTLLARLNLSLKMCCSWVNPFLE